jgi:hypothetical protein
MKIRRRHRRRSAFWNHLNRLVRASRRFMKSLWLFWL